jgi:thiamine biosynthesis protein ThiI
MSFCKNDMLNHPHGILINLDEIFLKGDNQGSFLSLIQKQLVYKIKKVHSSPFQCLSSSRRKLLLSSIPFQESVIAQLSFLPGVHSFYCGQYIPFQTSHKDSLQHTWSQLLSFFQKEMNTHHPGWEQQPSLSFKVTTKRSYKFFPLNSMEFSKELGGKLLEKYSQLQVKLTKPQIEYFCFILDGGIFCSLVKKDGVGGLPVGSNGRMLTFLSGGIDSPVASFMMSRRGVAQDFVFFHAYPFVGDEVVDKVTLLAKKLMPFQDSSQLHIIPYGQIQKSITQKANESYRTLFFRKYMFDIGQRLCAQTKSAGIITGDSVGQVSSQTLMNLQFLDQVTSVMVLRPLIGFNKIDIIHMAKHIDTYSISLIPHDDACQLFSSKHPVTYPDLSYAHHFIKEHSFESEIQAAIEHKKSLSL